MDTNDKIEIEALLFEQDHRIIPVIRRFLSRKDWPKSDPRRRASVLALVYLLLFSPTTVTVGGGFLAFLTLAAFLYQNHLLREQNKQQQLQIDRQTQAQEEQQLRDAYATLTTQAGSVPQLKRVAIEFLQNRRDAKERTITVEAVDGRAPREIIDLRDAFIDRVDLTSLSLEYVRFDRASFVDAVFDETEALHISAIKSDFPCDMQSVTIQHSVFDGSRIGPLGAPALDAKPAGPPKYQWSGTFCNCRFRDAKIHDLKLHRITFRDCDFRGAHLSRIQFKSVTPLRAANEPCVGCS